MAIAHPVVSGWDNFYVIVGSSAAALIGLQFVVIAIIRDTRTRTSAGSISAFGTPIVAHLGGALLIAAVMSAPWPTLFALATALVLCGLLGVAYAGTVVLHARRQTVYRPVWQDWLWHMLFPWSAYAALTVAGVAIGWAPRTALFVIGGATLGLLLVSIHNAWDTVTYLVIDAAGGKEPSV